MAPRGEDLVAGHDGSTHAAHAVRSGIAFAEGFSERLVLIRAWQHHSEVPARPRRSAAHPSADDPNALVRAALTVDCMPLLRGHEGIEVEYRAVRGAAADVLSQLSARARALVVAPRGLGGVLGPALGSVSERILHQATSPVLLAHPHRPGDVRAPTQHAVEPHAGPSERMLHAGSIVVGHDGSVECDHAVELAADSARALRRPLAIVRCWTFDHLPPGLLWRDGYVVSLKEASASVREELVTDLSSRSEALRDLDASYHGVLGDPAEVLERMSADAAVLVVGSRRRRPYRGLSLGSVSARCAHHAKCPVLIVPHRE